MGTIINAIAIITGGTIGLLFRKQFPERISQMTLQVLGLFTPHPVKPCFSPASLREAGRAVQECKGASKYLP